MSRSGNELDVIIEYMIALHTLISAGFDNWQHGISDPWAAFGVLPLSVSPMIKCNNLMNQALAAQQAFERGAFDGAMRYSRGELTEFATSNLFIVRNGTVLTPPLESGLLPGITRQFVFEIGRNVGIEVREQVLRDNDLFDADEAFLTSTTREVMPIVAVNERAIGNGKPGAITGKLLKTFREIAGRADWK